MVFSVQNHVPTMQNSAFPILFGQSIRSAEAKLSYSLFQSCPSIKPLSLFHMITTCSILPFPISAHPNSTPSLQDSVKCYTFQASCPDLFHGEATFSFPELTKYLICAFLMALSTSVTGSQPRVHIKARYAIKKKKKAQPYLWPIQPEPLGVEPSIFKNLPR